VQGIGDEPADIAEGERSEHDLVTSIVFRIASACT